MPTLSPALSLSEGLFSDQQGSIAIHLESGPVLLGSILNPYEGRSVDLSLHHFPPKPPLPREPGFGACMWNGHCPCGHSSNPAWLFSKTWKGVLKSHLGGNWTVGGVKVPFRHYMIGHMGRMVIYVEGDAVKPDASVDDLLSEAEGLLGVLEGLKKAVEDEVK